MKPPQPSRRPPPHPGHHWGSFADDPWSDDLDPVTGEAWKQAVRVSCTRATPTTSGGDSGTEPA